MSAKDLLRETEKKMQKTIESVRREFAEVRTGRAHPGLIEGLHIDYYGTPTMIKQVANITVLDPKTIVIQPWDISAIAEIEKAILNSKLGASPNNDGKIIRISIPPLSEERRQEMIKVVKDMAEQGRVSIRSIRREANEKLKKMQADKVISEDEYFRLQDEVQKITDKYVKEIDRILEEKNQDLTELHK